MNHMSYMTQMMGTTQSIEHLRHIQEFYEMGRMMIEELTPAIVKQVLEKEFMDIMIKVQTTLNGRAADYPDIKNEIIRMIREEVKKSIAGIKIEI